MPFPRVLLILILFSSVWCSAQDQRIGGQKINDFIVKENISQNGKIAILAVDSSEKVDEHINGSFKFTINGFAQSMLFHDGVAVVQQPIESSTFTLLKHSNQDKTTGKYFYIYKKKDELKIIQINGLTLILIPVLLLFFAYIFKRFIMVFIVVGFIFAYFHFSKGLELGPLLESAMLALKQLF